MSRPGLAWWLAALLPALGAVACISQSAAPLPLNDDAGGLSFDAGAPPLAVPDAAPVDSAPTVDSGIPTVDSAIPPLDSAIEDTGVLDASTPPLPCATNNGGCDPHATCANGDAGAICTCNAGYAGSGQTCASDCLTNNGGCDPNATCSNGAAGVVCACNPGFTGPGTTCFSNDYTEWPAPPDAPPETEYAVSADGTIVTDAVTGLVWQRQLFASPCPAEVDAGDGEGVCTWADAQTYCASLDTIALGGISVGWRLPSLVELLSIVNYEDGTPTLDTAIFPATPPVAFWARTPNAANAAQAWSVSFANGIDATQPTTTASAVRCVTSVAPPATTPTCGLAGDGCCYANSCGPDLACNASVCAIDGNYAQSVVAADSPTEPSSAVSADGSLVTDGVTGLHWQRALLASPCPSDGAGVCTWADAAAYCTSLSAVAPGGVTSGWRLPTVTELLSIVNYSVGAPTLDTALFPGTPAAVFWAQTPNVGSASQAWAVDFTTGLNLSQTVGTAYAVRCVSAVAPSASTACGTVGAACCYAGGCGPDLACNAASTCALDGNYAQALLPTDAPPETGYTVSPGGSTVTDGVTGLVWQRQLAANPCPSDAGTGGCTWGGAASYCDSLNPLTFGGYDAGWRLPTVAELISIANYAATPSIDPAPFANPPAASFWSSTPNAATPGQAWTVSYALGENAPASTTSTFDVRCVNASGATPAPEGCGALGQACCGASSCGATLLCWSGTCITNPDYSLAAPPPDAPPVSQYTVSGDTLTATDTVTGLVWSRSAGAASTWQAANTLCASLDATSLGGLSTGWRQPSVVELLSIVNYSVALAGPMVDATVFPSVTAGPYWSSTVAAGAPASAWSVNFNGGASSLVSTSTASGVLCVNGG